jgi:hypothetical protein
VKSIDDLKVFLRGENKVMWTNASNQKANYHGSRLMMAGLVGCRNNALCMVESRFRSTSQSWRSFAF